MDTAALTAEVNRLQGQFTAQLQQLQQDIAAAGGAPLNAAELQRYIVQSLSGGIAGTVAYAQGYPIPPGATPAASQAIIRDMDALRATFAAVTTVYDVLHPAGLDIAGLVPFLFLGALGGVLIAGGGAVSGAAGVAAGAGSGAASGASTAAAGASTAAASGALGGGVTLSTVGTSAALTTTAGTLAEASGALAASGIGSGAAAAASAATAASTLAGDLGKGVSALTGSSTLGDLVTSIVGNASSVVSEIENILSPLTDFAKEVLTGIDTLNKDFVQPIADVVSKDYTTITGLISEVHTLADSGIRGILAIPSALASAFTSLDAANQRLASLTGTINSTIAGNILVPGIGDRVASPLGDIHKVLNDAWNTPVADVGNLSTAPIDESLFKPDAITGNFNKVTKRLAEQGVVGKVIAILVESFNDILGFLASTENLVKLAAQKGDQLLPVEPLGVEEVVDAWWKLHFSEETALTELGRHGIDPTRAKLLYALKEWLPDANTALTLFYKGAITFDEVNASLARQGYSAADVEALSKGILEAVNPREVIQLAGRLASARAGFLPQTLQGELPDDIRQLYPARLSRADIGTWDWLGHWNIQSIDWWITAWYRGRVSDDELKLASQALNIPPELVPHLTEVAGATVQLWMIPDMMATGVFTEDQARGYLKYIGIEPNSVDVLIRYGQSKATAGKGPDLLGLGKLSDNNAKRMLEDGIIDKSEYDAVLVAHGYSPQAAALMADLAQQEIDLTARRTFANNVIAEFDLGIITLQQMQSQLASEGFTAQEVENYTTQAETLLLKKQRRLSNSDVKDFLKAGIFTESDALETLIANGWSQDYAEAFITLWQKAPAGTQAPGATPGANTQAGAGA